MKNTNLFRNLFLIALVILIASCSNISERNEITASQNAETKYARITLSVSDAQARTIFAETIALEDLQFTLKGEFGGENKFEKSWTSYSAMKGDGDILLEIGEWKFYLSVHNSSGTDLYTSELEKEIIEGDNALRFALKDADGVGNALVTLTFPAGGGVEIVKAGLLKIADQTEVEGFGMEPLAVMGNSVTYQKDKIPSGNYILKFEFLNAAGEEIFFGVMESIQIKAGRTSSKELKIEKLETVRFLTSELVVLADTSIADLIESVPSKMPASSFTWKTDKANVGVDENGKIVVTGTIAEYPEVVTVTVTPKQGGEPAECVFVVDDDLSLSRTELKKYCTEKGMDYKAVTEFTIPYGYTAIAGGTETDYVFMDSKDTLKTVTIPDTVTKIGDYAFARSDSASFTSDNPFTAFINAKSPNIAKLGGNHSFGDGQTRFNCKKILVKEDSFADYYNDSTWSEYKISLGVQNKNVFYFVANGGNFEDGGTEKHIIANPGEAVDISSVEKPKPKSNFSTFYEWTDFPDGGNSVSSITNPATPKNITYIYAKYVSGISFSPLENTTSITLTLDEANKKISATGGFSSYEWLVDGVTQTAPTATGNVLDLKDLPSGVYRIVVIADSYSTQYELNWEAE